MWCPNAASSLLLLLLPPSIVPTVRTVRRMLSGVHLTSTMKRPPSVPNLSDTRQHAPYCWYEHISLHPVHTVRGGAHAGRRARGVLPPVRRRLCFVGERLGHGPVSGLHIGQIRRQLRFVGVRAVRGYPILARAVALHGMRRLLERCNHDGAGRSWFRSLGRSTVSRVCAAPSCHWASTSRLLDAFMASHFPAACRDGILSPLSCVPVPNADMLGTGSAKSRCTR